MSVTSFIARPEVKEHLNTIIPQFSSKIPMTIQAPPITQNYSLVGTAYDYALRFEIQRRFPHAVTTGWVAKVAIENIPMAAIKMRMLSHPKAPQLGTEERLRQRADSVVKDAEHNVATYIKCNDIDEYRQRQIIAQALRLAKLDPIFRAGYIDNTCNGVDDNDENDINDIYRLLNITPFNDLTHPNILKLNPTFGIYSNLMKGADADIIAGDKLIDIKTTKNDKIEKNTLHQLISYLILARSIRKIDKSFPEINNLCIYFSRYGHLWILPTSLIINQPNYRAVENWYLSHASKIFSYPLDKLKQNLI